jgi:putative phosphoribosyl transferase
MATDKNASSPGTNREIAVRRRDSAVGKIEREEVTIGEHKLRGILSSTANSGGYVIFAHGSGSSRLSPRNQYVASSLNQGNISTLLLDLLTENEAQDRRNVFDIDTLSDRLISAASWLASKLGPNCALPFGYFGASTGAAAALVAAAKSPDRIAAVVSRGGRPDLADKYLPLVEAATLLIVGGDDFPVIPLNQSALQALTCVKKMRLIPGATHLFEEPGALDLATDIARNWFVQHFSTWDEDISAKYSNL